MIYTKHGALTSYDVEAIKRIEGLANLPKVGRELTPTAAFLELIAGFILGRWGRPVTPTQAWQIWMAVYEVESLVARKNQHAADVAFWYGINPETLSEEQFDGLYANLARVKAQKRLEEGNFDAVDYEMVYDLTMVAYEDPVRALAARAESMKLLIESEKRSARNV